MDSADQRDLISKSLRKIKHPLQREAALQWYSSQPKSADLRVVDRLARDWTYLVRRYGNPDEITPLFYSLFSCLAKLQFEKLPDAETVRYLVRSIRRLPTTENWENLNRELFERKTAIWPALWKSLQEKSHSFQAERLNAKVTFDEVEEELDKLLSSIVSEQSRWPIRTVPANLDRVICFCDGQSIAISDAIAVSPIKVINRLSFARLLLKEYFRIELRDFTLRSAEGREIWDRLESRRYQLLQNLEAWDISKQREVSFRPHTRVQRYLCSFLPSLRIVLMHFREKIQLGVNGLLNVLLDVIVEKKLAANWPDLSRIKQVAQNYETALRFDTRFLSSVENLKSAILNRAFHRESEIRISDKHMGVWNEIATVLEFYRETPRGNFYVSVQATLDIIDIIESKQSRDELDEALNRFGCFALPQPSDLSLSPSDVDEDSVVDLIVS